VSVLEEEAAHLGYYVRVTLILQLPQADQDGLVEDFVQIRFCLRHR